MNTVTILFFLVSALCILLYFIFPVKKYKWTVLLIASYAFYLFVGYKYVAFILFTTITTYITAVVIDKITQKSKETVKENKKVWDREQKKQFKKGVTNKKRLILAAALVINFGILTFLKYYNFFAGSLNELLGGTGFSAPMLKLFLPLGISFYTFQSMGYIIDVYREKVSPEKNIAKLALFVSFFPQIIQGPISIYSQLAHQLYEPHKFDFTRFKYGCELILWGLFKKLVVADRAVIAINTVTGDYTKYNGTTIFFMVMLYSLQLYADFSGGIDISRGVAQILGIDMIENFKRPYFSKSINEYWRRWHISLGAWLKDYLFYPLALSSGFMNMTKKIKNTKFGESAVGAHVAKVLPASIASFIVFLVVGLWHGANWKYVAFGVWNGGIIMLSTLLKPTYDAALSKLKINAQSWWYSLFQILRTFVIVFIGYIFDIAPNFSGAMKMTKAMLFDQHLRSGIHQIMKLGLANKEYILLAICTLVIFIVSVIQEKHNTTTLREMLDKKPFILRFALIFFCIITIIIFGVYGPGYNPSEFVYMQF